MGDSSPSASPHQFKFELGCLLRDGFMEMVKNVWESENHGSTPMEHWQAKIRRLRQHLRGWAMNTSGVLKKEKKKTLDNKLDRLDKNAETSLLSPQEVDLKQYLKNRLAEMLERKKLSGTRGQRLKNYWKVTQTPNISS